MSKLEDLWCYEAIRLRELQPPAIDDGQANQKALQAGDTLVSRLMTRAHVLSLASGLDASREEAKTLMRAMTLVACLVGLVGGISAALASLGDSAQPVNVIWTLISLLLLPTVMLGVWLISFVWSSDSAGWFGRLWQFAMGRLLRSGPRALTWKAWLVLAERARSQRWWLALLTHTIWLSVLLGMVLGLVAAFSLRHYTFVWQTTWLTEGVFVQLAQAIGVIPSKLGFTVPAADIIKASGNVAIDEPSARLAWANWLVGAVLVFGLLPRLLAMLVSGVALRQKYRDVQIKLDDTYALAVQQKLQRLSSPSVVDGPPGANDAWPKLTGVAAHEAKSEAALVALETAIGDALPARLHGGVQTLPAVDDRHSRHDAEQRLAQTLPHRLLIVVDARQTPDRGLIRTILTLGNLAVHTQVLLLHTDTARARTDSWRERLGDIGLTLKNPDELVTWLNGR